MKINKTKPIKKLMIFTIITVMIVSLFAVPAFADEPQITNLIGTTWRLDGLSLTGLPEAYGQFSIIGSANIVGSASGQPVNISGSFTSINCGYASAGSDSHLVELGECVAIGFTSEGQTAHVPIMYNNSDNYFNVEFTITGGDDISNPLFIDFINTYGTLVSGEADGEEQGIFAVWSQITQWIVQGLVSVSNAFYADGKLTLLGILCIIPLALGLAFLLIGIIQKFLRLRG